MELGFDRIIFFTPVWDEIQSLTFSLSLSIDWKWLFRYLVHFRVIGGWRIEKSGWGEAREVMKAQDNWWTYQVSIILVIGQWKTHISNPETCWSCRLVTWLLYLLPHEFAVHCNTTDFFFSCSNFTRFPESIIKIEKGDKKKGKQHEKQNCWYNFELKTTLTLVVQQTFIKCQFMDSPRSSFLSFELIDFSVGQTSKPEWRVPNFKWTTHLDCLKTQKKSSSRKCITDFAEEKLYIFFKL